MSVSNIKAYNIGPQDGWVLVVDGTTTPIVQLRVVSVASNTTFRMFSGTVAPTVNETGYLVDDGSFKAANFTTAGNLSKFWIKVPTYQGSSKNQDGRTEISVYSDGGVLQ